MSPRGLKAGYLALHAQTPSSQHSEGQMIGWEEHSGYVSRPDAIVINGHPFIYRRGPRIARVGNAPSSCKPKNDTVRFITVDYGHREHLCNPKL